VCPGRLFAQFETFRGYCRCLIMCQMYIIVAIIGTRWNKLVDEWAGRENGLTCILQRTLLSRKNTTNSLRRLGYCPAYIRVPVTCVDLLGTHIWEKIKRFLFDFNACVSSVLWCTMRFRCLAIGVSRVFVRDTKSPTPAATTSTII